MLRHQAASTTDKGYSIGLITQRMTNLTPYMLIATVPSRDALSSASKCGFAPADNDCSIIQEPWTRLDIHASSAAARYVTDSDRLALESESTRAIANQEIVPLRASFFVMSRSLLDRV